MTPTKKKRLRFNYEYCKCESIETTDVQKIDSEYFHVLCNKPVKE